MRTPSRRRAFVSEVAAVLVSITCGALLAAAVLVPAPVDVLPVVILTCIGCPVATAFELAQARASAHEPQEQLRRDLDRIPETPHPLGY
jgi:hypothetical protein